MNLASREFSAIWKKGEKKGSETNKKPLPHLSSTWATKLAIAAVLLYCKASGEQMLRDFFKHIWKWKYINHERLEQAHAFVTIWFGTYNRDFSATKLYTRELDVYLHGVTSHSKPTHMTINKEYPWVANTTLNIPFSPNYSVIYNTYQLPPL